MGTRKLYEVLYPFILEHNIKIGRDALFELLGEQGLLDIMLMLTPPLDILTPLSRLFSVQLMT